MADCGMRASAEMRAACGKSDWQDRLRRARVRESPSSSRPQGLSDEVASSGWNTLSGSSTKRRQSQLLPSIFPFSSLTRGAGGWAKNLLRALRWLLLPLRLGTLFSLPLPCLLRPQTARLVALFLPVSQTLSLRMPACTHHYALFSLSLLSLLETLCTMCVFASDSCACSC